ATHTSTLSLHDALPICEQRVAVVPGPEHERHRPRARRPEDEPVDVRDVVADDQAAAGAGDALPAVHGEAVQDADEHPPRRPQERSEEHTSELQSLAYLV